MRFSSKTTFNSIVDANSSRVAMNKRDLQAGMRKRLSTKSTVMVASLMICSLISEAKDAFAQNVMSNARTNGTQASKVRSPEEETGVSLRDFDAIRTMSSDYLENPDGGSIPLSEDDLWLPELALGQKKRSQTNERSVRVISYEEGKTKTEVRNLATQTPSSVARQNNLSNGKTNDKQGIKQANAINNANPLLSSNKTAQAVYAARVGAENKTRLTQATLPASNGMGGGFSDYSLNTFDSQLTQDAPGSNETPLTPTPASIELNSENEGTHNVPEVNDNLANYNTEADATTLTQDQQAYNAANAQGFGDYQAPVAPVNTGFNGYQPSSNILATETPVNNDFPTIVNESTIDSSDATTSTNVAQSSLSENNQPIVPNQNAEQLDLLGFDLNEVDLSQNNALPSIDDQESTVFKESFTAARQEVRENDQNAETTKNKSNEVSLEAAKLSESDLKKLTIEDIRISGLEMTTQQFNKIIKTRIGAKFNQQRLEEDKRALLQTKQFIDVAVSTTWTPDKPDKVIVNFDLTSRRMMRYVKVVGNKKISKHDILEELGIKPGESRLDPYEVENGRLRIIEFYKSKEYAEPHVEILRGDRPEDVGVVYLIDEGTNQRVLKTSFVGNTVVSAARLRSLISVKPGMLYFIGGKFTRDRLDADVEKLLEYYRQLGYFDARVDREYRESAGFAGWGKDNAWVTVRYIIDEGPRYKIRNFLFAGNRVLQNRDLEEKLKVKRGSYYYYSDVEADRIALRCQYQDLGYVRADITPNLVFTDEVGVVDIRYDIKEDHRYRVRDVIVDYVGTDSRTMTPVVLNMLDLTPGELLNGVKIRQSENTLRLSGYFNDKPSEGQLPEISVVPDDTSVFIKDKSGKGQAVKQARAPEDEDDDDERNDSNKITRGQVTDESSRRRALYIPYEETLKAKSSNSTKYASYGPSDATNATSNVRREKVGAQTSKMTTPQMYISPTRPFGSIVRGQTTIPSGFSSVTTRESVSSNSSYTPYGSSEVSQDSQYSGNQYANSTLESYERDDYAEMNSAAGFSAGVYNSIGQEVTEPITPEEDDVYNGDVLIKLQEGRTAMFTASIGVNSDYGLVGNVNFTERNFNLFRPPTNMFTCDGWKDAFRGGGQIFSVQASPGTIVQSYRVSWDVPYVFHTKNTFGVTGLYGDHSYDEWFESRYGGEIRLGRQWTPRFSTTLSGGIYNVEISQPQVGFVPDLNDAVGKHDEFTIGLSAAYDTRNHPYTPSEGYLVKGTIEQVLGDYQFPRVSLSGRYYKTLHKRVDGSGRWILALSTNLGWNGEDAPIYERYYGGGSTSVRGFDYRGITPRYAATGFGIGGNFEFYNSAELLIPVSGGDEFQIATFIDSGTVSKSIKDWGRYRIAPGVGLRFTLPMLGPAPLALDFAFPISKDPEDDTEIFSFSMSGSR